MANYTFLTITAYGDKTDIQHFDKFTPSFDGIDIDITQGSNSRKLVSSFKSDDTTPIVQKISEQIKNLSLLIEIEIEPAFSIVLYRDKYQNELQTLIEIPDYRDDEFFSNLHPDYLKNFETPNLSPELIQILSNTTTGKTLLDLIRRPESYK